MKTLSRVCAEPPYKEAASQRHCQEGEEQKEVAREQHVPFDHRPYVVGGKCRDSQLIDSEQCDDDVHGLEPPVHCACASR